MRKSVLFFLVALLAQGVLAAPASAESERIWGAATCTKPMPCDALMSLTADSPALVEIVNMATRCVERSFNFRGTAQIFSLSRGINSSLCLTPEKSTTGIAPRCCFKPLEKDPSLCRLDCLLKEK